MTEKPKRECQSCKKDISTERSNKKFCGKECKKKFVNEKYGIKFDKDVVNTSTRGAINELLICCDLMKRGYHVFRAVSPDTSCDIAIVKGNTLFRVEVTTGHILSSGGKVFYPQKDSSKFDILAVCVSNGTIMYFPDIETIINQS